MNLRRRRRGDVELVTLEVTSNNLGPDHSERLRVELATVAEEAVRMVLDLASVEMMTSSGIGALITTRRRLRSRGGRLVLTGLSPSLLEMLKKLRMDGLFEVAEDMDGAVARLVEDEKDQK